jgi:hypothetical protein
MFTKAFGIGLAAVLSAAPVGYAVAANQATASKDAISIQLSAAAKKKTTVRTTTVKRGHTTVKRTTVKKSTVRRAPAVRRTTTTVVRKPVVRHTTTVVRPAPVVRRNVVVVRRPYRAWTRRSYYGAALIGGIALGTVIAVNAAHAVPAAPGPNACWYWSDPAETHGYWDYCTPP